MGAPGPAGREARGAGDTQLSAVPAGGAGANPPSRSPAAPLGFPAGSVAGGGAGGSGGTSREDTEPSENHHDAQPPDHRDGKGAAPPSDPSTHTHTGRAGGPRGR